MKLKFETYKSKLFNDLLDNNYHNQFIELIKQLHDQGQTKKEIYELFLDFHTEIQVDLRTKYDEITYNNLSDFMDGFVDYGIGFKILPNESYR